MGIDYDTTVGFGVYLDDDMESMALKIIEENEDWNDEEYESAEDYLEDNNYVFEIIEGEIDSLELNCKICGYGNSYSDSNRAVLMMKYRPDNITSKPTEEEIQEFIDCCDKLGLKIVAEDIKFIDEIYIW